MNDALLTNECFHILRTSCDCQDNTAARFRKRSRIEGSARIKRLSWSGNLERGAFDCSSSASEDGMHLSRSLLHPSPAFLHHDERRRAGACSVTASLLFTLFVSFFFCSVLNSPSFLSLASASCSLFPGVGTSLLFFWDGASENQSEDPIVFRLFLYSRSHAASSAFLTL